MKKSRQVSKKVKRSTKLQSKRGELSVLSVLRFKKAVTLILALIVATLMQQKAKTPTKSKKAAPTPRRNPHAHATLPKRKNKVTRLTGLNITTPRTK